MSMSEDDASKSGVRKIKKIFYSEDSDIEN